MNFEILVSFIIATSALAFSPGPDNIYVMMQSIVHGKKYGIATVGGLITGCLVHTTFVAFGMSIIIKEQLWLFTVIKWCGAIYLIYLAYKVYKSSSNLVLNNNNIPRKTMSQLFKQGFVMNVLNPKVSLFFLSFFPAFLFSKSLNTIYQFYVLGFLFMITSFIIFVGLALLAGSISTYIKQNNSIGLILKWLQILVFIAIALYLILS
ncbi:LysE family translocator [Aurantibacter aestuarii]|uniref:Lysine transporter LysE n=1 Tax=Aurantibacter aestuarii TaxID=1266046 RepID=A0A2T1N9X9_9FLAO|nr:LysE family translocator [Aurantibacter aestuarii]PSG88680.1 lysine transporter LysE [Aurantibacter aestuarii]